MPCVYVHLIPARPSRVRTHLKSHPAAAAITVDTVIDEWLKYEEGQIKISSVSTYRAYAKKHIRPALGGIAADELTNAEVSDFLAAVSSENSGFAKKTVHLIANILKQVLLFGQKYGVRADPKICSIRFKSSSQKTVNALTAEEQRKILQTLGDCRHPSDLAIFLSLKTGLRVGEAAGLQWGDIDFEAGFLNVRRTVERIYRPDGTTEVYIGEPKSESSRRRVPLSPGLLKVLEAHRQADTIYIGSGSTKPQEVSTLQKHFKVVLKHAGVRDINFHALRHTFATRCVEKGFDAKSLSMILGHADVSTTLNTYVHPSMENLRNMMQRLEENACPVEEDCST